MSQTHLTPERIRWLHYKSAAIILSPKYISIESMEIWGGQYFPGQAGASMRRAMLQTHGSGKTSARP
ncbi:MAG: hypothetical protein ABF876_03165 [Acetobacter aceti]|uniref:Uncharacterized protein n=1 Tax=Acetobacter aceti TaxID=435 RepID=A0A1U9KFV3_ACEAC|nr:hypothetical protein [Acetobacter aceti]AQS84680.1 hypothetical protein A0U92_07710 [Acetobacter aceti]